MSSCLELLSDRVVTVDKEGNFTQASIPWVVTGVADENAAVELVRTSAPGTWNSLVLDYVTIEERHGETHYKVSANYREAEEKDDEYPEPTFTFETSGGSVHLTQSISTRNKYPSSAPDYSGAIGYDGDDVQGVDATRPVYQFSETHFLKPSTVTDSFRAALARKTGMYNNDSFRGFSEGEVLFLGASGRRQGTKYDDLWEVTYSFAVQQNQSSLTIGDISGISKRGWDYLWVRYEDDIDSSTKKVLKKPVAVYVEKIYLGTDFSSLIPAGSI